MQIKTKKIIGLLSFSLFWIASILTFSLVGYFSSSLSIDFAGNHNLPITKQIEIYLVCFAKSRVKAEAEMLNLDYTTGAQYVLKSGEYYYVVHSAYENENDAMMIIKNFEKKLLKAELHVISFPDIFVKESFSQEQRNLVAESFTLFLESFRSLSDLAVGFSSGVYDETYIKEKLQNLKNKIEKHNEKYYKTFSTTNDPETIAIGEYLADLLEATCLASSDSLWHTSIELLEIYSNLTKDMQLFS